MLRLQKQYFATRNTSALVAAKDKEKFVREKIKAIREERTRKQILTLWPSEK